MRMHAPLFIRWFSPAGRRKARLQAAQDLVMRASLDLEDAADILKAEGVSLELESGAAMRDGADALCKPRLGRARQELLVAVAELRGIKLPDISQMQ